MIACAGVTPGRVSAIAATIRTTVSTLAIAAFVAQWPPLCRSAELAISDEQAEAHRVRLATAGLELLIERQLRLTRVDARIRLANASLCGASLAPVTAIVARTTGELPESFRDLAYRRLGVDDLVRVLGVVPGFAGGL